MALLMIFSSQNNEKLKNEAVRLGFEWYQTDNIYRFLRYAKEAKPKVAFMQFDDDFNNDSSLLEEVKKALCAEGVCPRIFLNPPSDFDGDAFFENADFEKDNVQKYLH